MKKAIYLAISLSVLISLIWGCSSPKPSAIVLGNEQWAVSRALAYMTKAVLEEKGFNVEIKDEGIQNIYRGVNQSKIDVFMDAWQSGHDVYLFENNQMEDLGPVFQGCRFGLAVPNYYPIDSISHLLADSSVFGNVMYGVKKDAGVMIASQTALNGYGLDPRIVEMEEDELMKQLQLMIDQKQNFVTAAWTPHWKMKFYDLKFLTDTTHVFDETDQIHAVARPGFEKDQPRAAEIIRNISLTDEQITELLILTKDASTPEDLGRITRGWVKDNQDLVKSWTANSGS
ncbi:hypothetical protein KFE98_08990 [bacterium SCSIO 12741]|nr:hypothetical protein KFE98_08990 [bacterium SCSIO 12741]